MQVSGAGMMDTDRFKQWLVDVIGYYRSEANHIDDATDQSLIDSASLDGGKWRRLRKDRDERTKRL